MFCLGLQGIGEIIDMHIVYLTTEYVTESTGGGLATYLGNVSNIMVQKGHSVTIITLSDKDDEFMYLQKIRVIRVKQKEYRGNDIWKQAYVQIRNGWRVHNALRKLLSQEHIDIVQAANYCAIGLFRSLKIPTVVRVSSDSAFWRNANNLDFDYDKTLKEKNILDHLELFAERRADYVFAPSKCLADIVEKRSGRKVGIIESSYNFSITEADNELYRNKLDGKKYILVNSSLSALKGTHLMVQATDRILSKYSDMYIVYAGANYGIAGINKSLENIFSMQNKKFQGRVIYLGKIEQKQLFPIVNNAIACVLPSRIDNLPNSCIEAMSLGKIVIGTYGASFEQLIHNKENGLLIKRDSYKSLVKAIDYLMHLSDEERCIMGDNAKHTVERLEPALIGDRLMELYSYCIKKFKK